MNRLIKKTFENRGYTSEYLLNINNPKHGLLKDIDVLCSSLKQIHDLKQHIVVLPDFDMDGISSGVLGFAGLAELGFNVSLFIPHSEDGYGFTARTIGQLLADYPDTDAIITGDVGVSCYDGISAAKMAGIKVLVTDHHLQEKASNADCIVNPMRLDENYEHPYICGAHVLYQCLVYYSEKYCSKIAQEQISRLCVFAGIGTVSDRMSLFYENRELVRNAVSVMRLVYADGDDFIANNIMGCDIYRRAFRGLYNVLNAFSELGKISGPSSISEDFVGYYLAPMFNSIKRMHADVSHAFDVFFGADSVGAINYLIGLNEQRKASVSEYYPKLFEIDQPYAPYAYFSEAPAGILGLLAQKIISQSGMPVMVLRNDIGSHKKHIHGSARSPKWYKFLDKSISEGFFAAGHNPACGVGFTDLKELKSMCAFLKKDVKLEYDKLDKALFEFVPDFVISLFGDGDTGIDILLFAEYLSELKKYRPFGEGFPSPNVLLKFNASSGEWSTMGSVKQHLKIRLSYGFEVLLWNQATSIDLKDSDREIHVIGHLDRNKFNGVSSINFVGEIK